MKMRLVRLGFLGMAVLAFAALAAQPAAAKSKKKKTKTVTKTFDKCIDVGQAIPDPADGVPAPAVVLKVRINIPKLNGKRQDGEVKAFTSAGVRATHTFDGDLSFNLVSPGGRVVTLANGRGHSGDGYGSGAANCTGSQVIFGDTFPGAIASPGNTLSNPIVGSFRPETPLSTLVGGRARGKWTLIVQDSSGVDTGTLDAYSLDFTYKYKKEKKKKNNKK